MGELVLVATVGGTCAPIVRAIKELSPIHVYFIASSGEHGSSKAVEQNCGAPHGEKPAPSIVSQTELNKEQYELKELEDADNLAHAYEIAWHTLQQAEQAYPQAEKRADYTGGTKTMSVALALAALERGWRLNLVRGVRADLKQVLAGSEFVAAVSIRELHLRRTLQEAENFFNRYDFSAAEEILQAGVREIPSSGELAQRAQRLIALTRAFHAWDRFDHPQAEILLRPYRREKSLLSFWRACCVLAGADECAKLPRTGYETVVDVLQNAARRAFQGRYDDATARLYRALEWLAQIRLRLQYDLETGNVDLTKLPQRLQETYRAKRRLSDQRIVLALVDAYRLLQDLADPIGQIFAQEENHLLDVLRLRNGSILAHGERPVSKRDYSRMANTVVGFIQKAWRVLEVQPLAIPTFPQVREGRVLPREEAP